MTDKKPKDNRSLSQIAFGPFLEEFGQWLGRVARRLFGPRAKKALPEAKPIEVTSEALPDSVPPNALPGKVTPKALPGKAIPKALPGKVVSTAPPGTITQEANSANTAPKVERADHDGFRSYREYRRQNLAA